jgi:rhodanese-related sulfurtransferase
VENGAQIVDARPIVQYATAHIPGSLSIELRPVFATWLGWLVNPSRPVVFILDDSQDRHELVRQCLTVGVELLVGELVAGYQTWAHLNLPGAATELIEPGALDAATVLDVRQHDEFLGGHLPDAHNIELGALRNATDLLPTHPLVVMCGHGERAMTGASVLEQAGRGDLEVLVGGPEDWAAACGRILATGP